MTHQRMRRASLFTITYLELVAQVMIFRSGLPRQGAVLENDSCPPRTAVKQGRNNMAPARVGSTREKSAASVSGLGKQ